MRQTLPRFGSQRRLSFGTATPQDGEVFSHLLQLFTCPHCFLSSPNPLLPGGILTCNAHRYFSNTSDGRIMKRNNGQEHFISQKKILEVFDGASGKRTRP